MVAKYDPSSDQRRVTGYALAIAAIGWISLLLVVMQTVPWRLDMEAGRTPPRDPLAVILFYVALFVAVAATLLPPAAYLNVRFGQFDSKQVFQRRFLRQSILGALFVVVLAWMQMERMLSSMLALILLSVFVLIETFLITREMPKER